MARQFRRIAVFVTQVKDGKVVRVRKPYDVIEVDPGFMDAGIETYLQPCYGRTLSPNVENEVYHDVRIYDVAPPWDLCGTTGVQSEAPEPATGGPLG